MAAIVLESAAICLYPLRVVVLSVFCLFYFILFLFLLRVKICIYYGWYLLRLQVDQVGGNSYTQNQKNKEKKEDTYEKKKLNMKI